MQTHPTSQHNREHGVGVAHPLQPAAGAQLLRGRSHGSGSALRKL